MVSLGTRFNASVFLHVGARTWKTGQTGSSDLCLLHRACSIDMQNNFRAFLQPAHLDWETASRLVMSRNNVNIRDTLHKTPKGIEQSHGWEGVFTGKHGQPRNQLLEYDNVLKMIWGENKTSNEATIQKHLDESTSSIDTEICCCACWTSLATYSRVLFHARSKLNWQFVQHSHQPANSFLAFCLI